MLDFRPEVTTQFVTPEQASNYVRSKIGDLRWHMKNQPLPATNLVNDEIFKRWFNKYLIVYGQAIGAIQTAQAFGHISVEIFYQLKNELLATTLRKTADAQMRP